MGHQPTPTRRAARAALVFSGGVGLGAYQAGAYQALAAAGVQVDWVAGSSVGAVNAALIAGNAPQRRVRALRSFWTAPDVPVAALTPHPALRKGASWLSVLSTRLFGAVGHFAPRLQFAAIERFQSFYDLAPMRHRLEQLLDFDLLNRGPVRVSVATTDIVTGELVTFDSSDGRRLTTDHLLTSCGFLPEFAPVAIEGRWLGDGGLYANAPVEIVLAGERSQERTIFVVDLFAPDGETPGSLEAALERKNDLFFANQTLRILHLYCRLAERPPRIYYLSYRAAPFEAGPEKTFDYSADALHRRWEAGALDMREALQHAQTDNARTGLHIVRRHEDFSRRSPRPARAAHVA